MEMMMSTAKAGKHTLRLGSPADSRGASQQRQMQQQNLDPNRLTMARTTLTATWHKMVPYECNSH